MIIRGDDGAARGGDRGCPVAPRLPRENHPDRGAEHGRGERARGDPIVLSGWASPAPRLPGRGGLGRAERAAVPPDRQDRGIRAMWPRAEHRRALPRPASAGAATSPGGRPPGRRRDPRTGGRVGGRADRTHLPPRRVGWPGRMEGGPAAEAGRRPALPPAVCSRVLPRSCDRPSRRPTTKVVPPGQGAELGTPSAARSGHRRDVRGPISDGRGSGCTRSRGFAGRPAAPARPGAAAGGARTRG